MMAEIPTLRLRVEMDKEKLAEYDAAVNNLQVLFNDTETAARRVRNALYDLQDALVFKADEPNG